MNKHCDVIIRTNRFNNNQLSNYTSLIISIRTHMNQFTIRVKHMGQSLIKWQNIVTPKLEHWVDKYKIVKYGCVLGIGKTIST